MRVEAILLCWIIGCAGKAAHSGNDEMPGVAGAAASPHEGPGGAAGGGAVSGSAGGSSSLGGLSSDGGGSGAPESGGSTQCSVPASCGIEGDSYVLVVDGALAVQMSAPIDDACAHCRVPCEDCATECEVSATGTSSCGSVRLNVAVCAGAGRAPPCLDTVADPAYYLDVYGKRWPVVSLSGRVEGVSWSRALEADLTLLLSDGDGVRELPAHVRVCAELSSTLLPCKKVKSGGAP